MERVTESPVGHAGPAVTLISALALDLTPTGDGGTRGRIEVEPFMWAPGTDRVRLGLLATIVDVVGGSPPTGPINPTVDLRIQLLARPPASGVIEAVSEILRAGRRLYVTEVLLYAEGDAEPFGRSSLTFINQLIPPERLGPRSPTPMRPPESFDALIGPQLLDDAIAITPHPRLSNNGGTVQGGVQAFAAELAAERLLAAEGPYVVTDLEIRYLSRVKVGPLLARAEVVRRGDAVVAVRANLTDGGDDDRLVSFVPMTCRRADAE